MKIKNGKTIVCWLLFDWPLTGKERKVKEIQE